MNLQDEIATTSSAIGIPMSHIPKHDVAVFGVSSDLNALNLQTDLDILRYYFYLSERAKTDQKKFSYKQFTNHVTDRLVGIWEKLGMEIISKKYVAVKLNSLVVKYQAEYRPFSIQRYSERNFLYWSI